MKIREELRTRTVRVSKNERKNLLELHRWWDYGIHPILGWKQGKQINGVNETRKYSRTPISLPR